MQTFVVRIAPSEVTAPTEHGDGTPQLRGVVRAVGGSRDAAFRDDVELLALLRGNALDLHEPSNDGKAQGHGH